MTGPAAPVAHGRRVFRNTLVTGAVGVFSLFANFFVIGEAGHHLGRDPYGFSRWHWRSRSPRGT